MARPSSMVTVLSMVTLTTTSTTLAMGPPGAGHRPFPVERFATEIGLSTDQVRAFRELEDRTLKTGLQARGDIAFAEHELWRMIAANLTDHAAIFAKVDEIAALRAQQRKIAIRARLEGRGLRGVTTPVAACDVAPPTTS